MRKSLLSLIGLFTGLSVFSSAYKCNFGEIPLSNTYYDKYIVPKDGTIVANLKPYQKEITSLKNITQNKIYKELPNTIPKTFYSLYK